MDARLQRRVQRYGWDRASEHYERFWSRQLAPAQDRLLDMASIEAGESVLDIACGTGLVTFPAAERVGSEGRVVGTDISGSMVEAVRREVERRGLTQVEPERMGAEKLDLPDDLFDVALCALGLMYVPDPLTALREMRRVLRPGGRAVASVWGRRERCGWAEIFPIVDSRVASEVCPMFFQLGSGDVLERTFLAAGFENVEVERLDVRLDYASRQEALGAAFVGGPVAMAYSRFDPATRDAAHAEYLDSIAEHRHGDAYSVPGEFVIVAGRRPRDGGDHE